MTRKLKLQRLPQGEILFLHASLVIKYHAPDDRFPGHDSKNLFPTRQVVVSVLEDPELPDHRERSEEPKEI